MAMSKKGVPSSKSTSIVRKKEMHQISVTNARGSRLLLQKVFLRIRYVIEAHVRTSGDGHGMLLIDPIDV